jgi:hypothetical protein
MTTTLFYYPGKEKPNPRKGAITFDGVNLEPGINTLTSEQFTRLKKHPDYQKYLEWGAITPTAEPLPLFLTYPSDPLEKTLKKNDDSLDFFTSIPTSFTKTTRKKVTPVPSEDQVDDKSSGSSDNNPKS